MNADSITFDHEEDGMWLVIQLDEEIPLVTNEGVLRVRIQNLDLDAFYDTVRLNVGAYLRERDEAKRAYQAHVGAFHCDPDESAGAYELSDPKHPQFHSVHADIWDARDGK